MVNLQDEQLVGNDLCLLVENSIVNGSCRNRGNKNCGRPLCCCAWWLKNQLKNSTQLMAVVEFVAA